MLSSSALGLVVKIDLLEGAPEGTVVPVDTKRGSPPDLPERAWEPERVQICVQGLLLREHGYQCDRGMLWFAETRERVAVELDDDLVARTRELLDELRAVAASSFPPAPLVDSSKCPRCSLVGICLPDEVNTLAERSAAPPRRLIPRDDAAKPLSVTEQGSYVTKDKGRIEVTKKDERLVSVRTIHASQLCISFNAQVHTHHPR